MRTDKIYKNQSQLVIRLYCGQKITGALEVYIKYRKPSGTTGQWTAQIENGESGIISYSVPSKTVLDEAGVWSVWTYVVFANGKGAPGTPLSMLVEEEGR